MFFSIGLLISIMAAGIFGGIVVDRRFSAWSFHYRLLAVLLPAGSLVLAVSWVTALLSGTDYVLNQARLAPLFGLRYGYSLYYPPEVGPVMGTVYGPISYLAYFPSLFAHTPTPALLIGTIVASFYYFLPVAWIFLSGQFRRQEGRVVGLFLLLILGFWTIGSPPLRYSCFHIHADAPALGFGAIACVLLMRKNETRVPVHLLVLSAFFAVLAIFSKQSLIFLAPTLLCFIWITDGRRSAMQFSIGIAALSAVIFGLFSAFFSARDLYLNLYAFPSQVGFGDAGGMNLPERGALYSAKVLHRVGQRFWEYSRWPILAVAVCYIVEAHAIHLPKFTLNQWLRRNRWAVFHFVALGGLPLAVIFGAKLGGDVNAFSVHLYFVLIGLLLFVGHLMLKYESLSRPAVAACVILAATVIPTATVSFDIPKLIQNLWVSDTEKVYQYEKQHPGETYFSFFPLPVLMAEGRMYHFEYAVFDRELGRYRISQSHFLRYIPPHPTYVQREDSSPLGEYLPQFSCPTIQPGIPGWKFYTDCSVENSLFGAHDKKFP